MRRSMIHLFGFALFFLLCSQLAAGLDDWQPVTPEELKMGIDPAHPSDAVILYHEEVSDDNKNDRQIYMRVKILTDKGKRHADVEIPYGGPGSGIANFKARTIAPDGSITPFTGKPFDTTIVKGQGVKYMAKTFTFPNVQTGSIIEWRYSEYWADNLLYAAHWSVQQNLPQKRAKFVFIPFSKGGYYVRDAHGDSNDRLYSSFIGLPEDTKLKDYPDGRLELELKDIPAFEEEEFGLPPDILKMRVDFYYGTLSMRKPDEFWRDEGKYWSKEVDKFIGHSSSIAAEAAKLVAASDTPEQKAKKIYAAVQKMKNSSYEVRDIAEELAVQKKEPRSAEDILQEKAGSRTELTRLFVAMVRSQNIPAFVMKVADRDQTIFRPNIPNPRQLRSEIAIVSFVEGKEVFLDPGTPYCPFGLLEWKHTSTQGLRQTASGKTEIVQTPAPGYRDAFTQRFIRANIDAEGTLKGKITLAWLGQEGLLRRLHASLTDDAGKKKELEDELKAVLPANAEVQMESCKGWDDPEVPLVAVFNATMPSFASSTGKRLLVPVSVFQSRSRPVLTHAERKTPVYFPYPYQSKDDILIGLPPNVQVESVPETKPIKAGFAYYSIERTAKGRVLEAKREFAIGDMAFPVADYSKLKEFFEGVNAADSEPLVATTTANQ